jgi:hypothetical protein
MVKKFCLLLAFVFVYSFVINAQSIQTYSSFSVLSPLEMGATDLQKKAITWTVIGSKLSFLPRGGQTALQLQSHWLCIQLQQQIWDSYLKRNSFCLQGTLYPSKSLQILPLFMFEQMNILESKACLAYKGEILLRYTLNPNWRLASSIS